MLDPLYQLIGWLLAFYYSFFPSEDYGLGIAIILLTCTVMLAMFPLTAKQTRSMIAIQRVQPEIKRLQLQHKDDKQKQNEELLKFYQENKINPLAGCLPLIVQSPIFIALLGVLHDADAHVPKTEGRMGELYRDLCAGKGPSCDDANHLHFLGMDLSKAPNDLSEVVNNFYERFPYYAIVAIVILLGWYQTRQTMLRQQRSGNTVNSPINAQMQTITKVMPVLFGVFTFFAPAGVGLYFVTSSVWRIGQQQLVLNKFYDDDGPTPKKDVPQDTEPPPPPGRGGAKAPPTGDAGDKARPSRPSPHTSRKKRKRR